ncbi:MAG: alanine racemase [Acidobacteria bacterium]|nr:MAG: alanine racemase [Acidobacteriota bacterium]
MTVSAKETPPRPGSRPCWVEVDLTAIAANIKALNEFCGVPIAAVVKADGYGHGSVEVARAAIEGGAAWLAVALLEEGRTLRDAGIGVPILLLAEPPPESAPEIVAAGLTPAIYTETMLAALSKAAGDAGISVHLKVDTGMHRLGASPERALELAEKIAATRNVELSGVWTHLAASDEVENPYTIDQVHGFERVLNAINAPSALRHAANSAGAIYHADARYSLVRVGISIYGVPPSPGRRLPAGLTLQPALAWKAKVAYAKQLPAGAPVGYGLTYRMPASGRVATIPVGYADGYFRSLGNRAEVLIGGKRFPVAGAVSMDNITVDLGEAHVDPGDEVVLLGRQGNEEITATELAERAGTISYEVLARIGKRVPRVYM